MRELLDLVDVARRAAAAAAVYLRAVRPPPAGGWTEKGRNDFVTGVDRRAEEIITAALQRLAPGSAVLGEELSPKATRSSGLVWVVDPLDGTTNFLHGYPQYAVSIGGLVDGNLVLGVVHDVPRDLVYHAASGAGAWLGASRLRVSPVSDPRRALLGTGFPFKQLDELDTYLRQLAAALRGSSGVRRAGTASLDLVDVARGRFDGFFETWLAPWDVAGGVALVREAGGIVTTFTGDEDVLRGGSVLAANPKLYPWLRACVEGA